jgi:hypothetical protein
LCCYRPGQASRLIYRRRGHLLLKGARKGLSWKDYRDLLVRSHIQLGGPIVVVRVNLNTYVASACSCEEPRGFTPGGIASGEGDAQHRRGNGRGAPARERAAR